MGVIHKLDSKLTNMIAAGEVVERPSGVIKELIENAIDANSKNINVTIVNGGIDMIEVSDDGKGMDKQDMLMAFERHATSKIIDTNDLFNIQTLGFRGEALPSIASVSKVSMTSNDGSGAYNLKISYGEFISHEPTSANNGTTINVSGLFYKTPARLKHLKSGAYEASLISDIMTRFAFSHPEIAFSLTSDNKMIMSTSGSGDLLEVIFRIYGKDVAKKAFKIEASDFDYELSGYMIHPQFSRANKYAINVFLNNRIIKSYKINNDIIESYYDYLPKDRYPIVILNITMDSKLVDVNVHPSKWEVRLSKEMQLDLLIKDSLKKTLKHNMNEFVLDIEPKTVEKPKVETPVLFNSLDDEIVQVKKDIIEKIDNKFKPVINEPVVAYQAEKRLFPHMDLIGQMHGKFILASCEKGLYIIDQHAACERVNYEYYLKMFDTKTELVDLLVPVLLKVNGDVVSNIDDLNRYTADLQVVYEAFGDDSLIVRRIPFWMQEVNEQQFLMDLVDHFKNESDIDRKRLQKKKIATIVCHASVRFNHVLTMDEMRMVIDNLSKCEQPFECPHGRPTFILLEDKVLEKEFLR